MPMYAERKIFVFKDSGIILERNSPLHRQIHIKISTAVAFPWPWHFQYTGVSAATKDAPSTMASPGCSQCQASVALWSLQSCSFHSVKVSITWETLTHYRVWWSAWDADLLSLDHSFNVLTLMKYFPGEFTSVMLVYSYSWFFSHR